jgi:hypothetical protein
LPVTVISLEIEYAARLANSRVKTTEKADTITLFMNGVAILLSVNNLRKLAKLHTAGRDNGFVYISKSVLNAPVITIMQGTKITDA